MNSLNPRPACLALYKRSTHPQLLVTFSGQLIQEASFSSARSKQVIPDEKTRRQIEDSIKRLKSQQHSGYAQKKKSEVSGHQNNRREKEEQQKTAISNIRTSSQTSLERDSETVVPLNWRILGEQRSNNHDDSDSDEAALKEQLEWANQGNDARGVSAGNKPREMRDSVNGTQHPVPDSPAVVSNRNSKSGQMKKCDRKKKDVSRWLPETVQRGMRLAWPMSKGGLWPNQRRLVEKLTEVGTSGRPTGLLVVGPKNTGRHSAVLVALAAISSSKLKKLKRESQQSILWICRGNDFNTDDTKTVGGHSVKHQKLHDLQLWFTLLLKNDVRKISITERVERVEEQSTAVDATIRVVLLSEDQLDRQMSLTPCLGNPFNFVVFDDLVADSLQSPSVLQAVDKVVLDGSQLVIISEDLLTAQRQYQMVCNSRSVDKSDRHLDIISFGPLYPARATHQSQPETAAIIPTTGNSAAIFKCLVNEQSTRFDVMTYLCSEWFEKAGSRIIVSCKTTEELQRVSSLLIEQKAQVISEHQSEEQNILAEKLFRSTDANILICTERSLKGKTFSVKSCKNIDRIIHLHPSVVPLQIIAKERIFNSSCASQSVDSPRQIILYRKSEIPLVGSLEKLIYGKEQIGKQIDWKARDAPNIDLSSTLDKRQKIKVGFQNLIVDQSKIVAISETNHRLATSKNCNEKRILLIHDPFKKALKSINELNQLLVQYLGRFSVSRFGKMMEVRRGYFVELPQDLAIRFLEMSAQSHMYVTEVSRIPEMTRNDQSERKKEREGRKSRKKRDEEEESDFEEAQSSNNGNKEHKGKSDKNQRQGKKDQQQSNRPPWRS